MKTMKTLTRVATQKEVDAFFKDLGATGYLDLQHSPHRVYLVSPMAEIGTVNRHFVERGYVKVLRNGSLLGTSVQVWDNPIETRFHGTYIPF